VGSPIAAGNGVVERPAPIGTTTLGRAGRLYAMVNAIGASKVASVFGSRPQAQPHRMNTNFDPKWGRR